MLANIQDFYDKKYVAGTEIPRSFKRFTVDCVPATGGLDVLDVGCGSGIISTAIAAKGHRVQGIDISPVAIEKYRSLGFEGQVADIESGIDFPDQSFDIVFCSEVIEHMTSPETLVAHMARLLRPGGQLILSTPNSAFWLYRLFSILGYTLSEVQHPKHFQFFSRRSLLKLLYAADLKPKQVAGRNMYIILPDVPSPLGTVLTFLGFQSEVRFRTGKRFWHLSHKSTILNSIFADTLILVMEKPLS